MMKKIQYFIIASTVLFTACSVVEENTPQDEEVLVFEYSFPTSATITNSYLSGLNGNSWKSSQFTIEGIEGFQDCRLDDVMSLNSDFTYRYDGGLTLCGAEDNVMIKAGTWSIDYDTQIMSFDAGTDREVSIYIAKLTATELVFQTAYFGLEVVGKMVKE